MINYQWIKLDVNILDDAKIKIIRSHPDGNSILILWIGLLCLAMKAAHPGIVEISNALPYSTDDFSNLFDIEKKTVELGLGLFRKYKMIEISRDGAIEIINFAKHQSIEELERKRELARIRVANYRKRLVPCNALLTHTTREVTTIEERRGEERREEKDTSKTVVFSDSFLSFWQEYPKHTSKKSAFKEWQKIKPDIQTVLTAIKNQKKSKEQLRASGQFVAEWPDPERWIKKERWNDEFLIVNTPVVNQTSPYVICEKCGAEVLKDDFIEDKGQRYCSKCPRSLDASKKLFGQIMQNLNNKIGGMQ